LIILFVTKKGQTQSENFSAIVGLFLVSFFIVTSWALSFAIRRFLSVLINAAFAASSRLID
jgi:hypothetical protein